VNRSQIVRNIELQTITNTLTPLQAKWVDIFFKAFNTDKLGFQQFVVMMFWIDKFMLYSGSNLLLNQKQFSALIGDRTFNWKIRETID